MVTQVLFYEIYFETIINWICFNFSGAVLLDIEEEDMPSIAQRIVEQLVYIDQLEPECKKPLLKILLKKHRSVFIDSSVHNDITINAVNNNIKLILTAK